MTVSGSTVTPKPPQAGTDQGTALTALASQPCTFTFPDTDIDLATDTTHGPIGVYTPGVYCTRSTRAASIGTAGITLSGSGTYLFRIDGALTTVANSHVTLSGASACDVFWTPTGATTLGANTTFAGTDIDDAGITVGSTTAWTGRALAFATTVTTDTDTITVPTCAVPPAPGQSGSTGTLTVVKRVINDNGGTKTISDFQLFVDGNGRSSVVSGHSNNFPASNTSYTVSETADTKYALSFSGDCDSAGHVTLNAGDDKFCILTNDDIGAPVVVPPVPPLIDVVKVPNPLSLPAGPGPVTYTYTLRNIGTVPVTDVTMIGDTCSPIVLASGDTNSDAKLQVSETWVYRCSTTLSATHTNTVVATGWANGLSATDIASATVVVGVPLVPPLIHVTKVPSPLTFLAGGGSVTYTEKITNPGTVALSNVRLTDDKCSPMTRISGDANGDAKLDPSETWTYTCGTNIASTTTDTAIASGEANGLTVRDLATATVVVAGAVPALPKTGFAPTDSVLGWGLVAAGMLAVSLLLSVIWKKRSA